MSVVNDASPLDDGTIPHSGWEDGQWTSLSHLSGVVRAELCVVGLGGSGLAAIHAALDRGIRVAGIDAGSIGGGAAGANGGFLLAGTAKFYHESRATMGSDRARTLYLRTLEEIGAMQSAMPDIVRRTGSLRIAMSTEELEDCERQRTIMQADGLAVEDYDGPEGKGLLFEGDGVFNPLLRCRRLAVSALQRGARLYEHSAAVELRSGGVRAPQGSILCDWILVAVDGRLEQLFPELTGRIRTTRLQMLATAPTTDIEVSRAVYARWGYEYWQQTPDRRILLGGFRDHALEDEWTYDTVPTPAIQNRLTEFLRIRLGVRAAITHRWAASVGYTSDGVPIAAEIRPKIWAVGGYSGTGNVIGSLCGQGVVAALDGDGSLLDLLSTRPSFQQL